MPSSIISRIIVGAGALGTAAIAAVSGWFYSAPSKPEPPKQEQAAPQPVKPDVDKQEAAKQDAARIEAARIESAKQDAAKQDAAKQEAAKQETAKQNAAKQDAAKQDAAKQEAVKLEAARQAAAQQDAAKQEAARQEAAKVEAARLEAAKQEAAKQDAARLEAARQEAAKQDAAKQAATRVETAKQEAAKQRAARPGTSGSDVKLGGVTVKNWGYQLQNEDVETIANSPYDVIVMDYSRDTTTAGAFTPADLARMKKKPDGSRRIVLSYISIGEAEDYRYYWQERGWNRAANRSGVVDEENPEWKSNYSVRYWLPEWQDVIVGDDDSYMARINKAGFDGVYLDKIDVCETYEGRTPAGTVASDLMIQFVRKLSTIMKARNPNFLIIAQNAEFLLPDDDYRAAIDGIGKEDILYRNEKVPGTNRYQDGKSNDEDTIKETIELVNKLKADGKAVMAVEYITDGRAIAKAAERLQGEGYLFYVGPRDLARLAPPVEVALRDASHD